MKPREPSVKSLAIILAFAASASAQTVWTSTWSSGMPGTAGVGFNFHSDPPLPLVQFSSSSSGKTVYGSNGGYAVTHRYFRSDADHTYLGYDLVLEDGPQPDTYKASFLELGIGPTEFIGLPYKSTDIASWKKLASPPLPQSRVLKNGDSVDVTVWIDPASGQKLIDTVQVRQNPRLGQSQVFSNNPLLARPTMTMPARNMPTVPSVEGTARDFQAGDAEMRLVQPRVTVNGALETSQLRNANVATGTLTWFYLPQHGRYILSLVPRPDLGFVKAGEIRGGAIKFKSGDDEFLVESFQPVAPGSSPYVLYVLHDKDFEPTSRNQADHLLFGSVSPAELAALFKK